jgi:hypothetical protein
MYRRQKGGASIYTTTIFMSNLKEKAGTGNLTPRHTIRDGR